MLLLNLFAYITVVVPLSGNLCLCLNVTDASLLYSRLFKGYNKNILPLINQNESVKVYMYMYLLSINSFDELSGELAFSVLFNFTWREERMLWSVDDFGGKTSILFAPEDLWKPKIFVRELVDNLREIGNISDMIRIAYDGLVEWTVGAVLKVACPVDVTFFPFDSQTCPITFTTLTVRSEELKLSTLLSSADTVFMTNNSQWMYVNSTMFSFAIPNHQTGIHFEMTLKRRSEFYVIYLIIPLVFLGKINNLVFAIPAFAGERNSVAITSFLSFAVYMQIVNNSVPQSSAPIAYIYFYLMFLLLYSSYIMFACIVSLRIYDKHGKVPAWIQTVVLVLRFRYCKQSKHRNINTIHRCDSNTENFKFGQDNVQVQSNTEDKEMERNKNLTDTYEEKEENKEITWTIVGKTFDIYCGIFNFVVFISFTWSTFIQLYLNKVI